MGVRLGLALLAVLLALAPRAGAADAERWYAVMLLGERAGWMRETERTAADGALALESEMRLSIARGGLTIEVAMISLSEETPDGKPIRMRSEQRMAAAPVVTTFRFTDAGVEVTEESGGRTTTRTEPTPAGEWLMPIAAERHIERRARAGDDTIEYRSIDATTGLTPVTITRRRLGTPEPVEVLGKVVPAARWSITQSIFPDVQSHDYLAEDGALVRGEVNFGGVTLTMLAADKETATLPAKAPEMMVSTFVHPSRPIASPRSLRRAVYTVRVPDGQTLPDLPCAGHQKATRIDGRSVRVTLDLATAGAAEPGDEARPEFREASVMIDGDDPEIRALVPLEADAEPKAALAVRLRGVAHRHITTKSLDVGFATASEAARTRQGDCTEHAVLLAAMLRAAGVPSRVVSGVVYVDQFAGGREVFGFHMWTQALLEDADAPGVWRWVDLDATLPQDRVFDAAHIAFIVSALPARERMNSLTSLAPLLGRLEIDVVETE